MAFSKRFPRNRAGSSFPEWIEVYLSEEEEREVEKRNSSENIRILSKAIDDAREIAEEKGLKDFQGDILTIALALFEKQASHNVYAKEARCKEKFDRLINSQGDAPGAEIPPKRSS